MPKFDSSCGLTEKQVGIVKFAIKRKIVHNLPILPDDVETILFLQGRDAWRYSWRLLEHDPTSSMHPMIVEVEVKLKKELHPYCHSRRHLFRCGLRLKPDIYSPVITINGKVA